MPPDGLLREIPRDSLLAFAHQTEIDREVETFRDPDWLASEAGQRFSEELVLYLKEQLNPLLESPEAESFWLYDSSRSKSIGGTRGYAALRGSEAVEQYAFALYD